MYVYIYIYIYIYIYVCIYLASTYRSMYVCTCVHTYICMLQSKNELSITYLDNLCF